MLTTEDICHKIRSGIRLTTQEALWLYKQADDATIADLATTVKKRFHPANSASYLIMAIVNYTNICVAKCDYCSFYKLPHQQGGYLLNFAQVCQKIEALTSYGGTLVGFNGGFHPKLSIHDFAEFFQKIHAQYPSLTFYEMTIAEFMFYCKKAKLSYEQGAKILQNAGTQWITGGGAEILSDSFRMRHSPGKYKAQDYFTAQKAVLDSGMGSTATMVIGFDECLDERFDHLAQLRNFQDQQSNKLASFLCWTYKAYGNEFNGKEVSHREYLRWLGICRIYLDNIEHIRTSVLTQNERALEGLNFGANDFDLPTEDEVTEKAGATITKDFEKILESAADLGFTITHRKPWPIKHLKSQRFQAESAHEKDNMVRI